MKKIAWVSAISLVACTAFAGENYKFERSLALSTDRLSAVEFDLGAGQLNIVGTQGNELKINATIESDDFKNMSELQDAFEKNMQFTLERESEYAMVTAKSINKMTWGKSKNIMIHLEVEVPKGMDLVIDDSSGPISVENIDGEVSIDDGSGSIVLKQIANDVHIDDGSGSIQIEGVSGDLFIDDGSGPIHISGVTGSVAVEDGSGEIIANDIGGDFKVDDGSGSIDVNNLSGEFELIDDGSGSIKVNGKRWGKK